MRRFADGQEVVIKGGSLEELCAFLNESFPQLFEGKAEETLRDIRLRESKPRAFLGTVMGYDAEADEYLLQSGREQGTFPSAEVYTRQELEEHGYRIMDAAGREKAMREQMGTIDAFCIGLFKPRR